MTKSPHIEVPDEQMIAVMRAKTPAERLAIAHDMWAHARKQIIAILRFEHPEWPETKIKCETARRLSHGAV